jgi:hypothetical protein
MRNDARPIGEEFRDIAGHDRQNVKEKHPDRSAPDERARAENTPFVVNRDPGDEELPPDSSER